MLVSAVITIALNCISTALATQQYVFSADHVHSAGKPVTVAIIGAGAAGSSAAWHLSRYASEIALDLDITVYDRRSYIGGRSTTVNVYDDPYIHAELGASIFVEMNHILIEAVKTFNLSTSGFGSQARARSAAPSLGIWNGEEFVVTLSPSGPSWWDTAKLLWRYGMSPIRTRNLMKTTVGKFLNMYDAPHFPFGSLNQVIANVDLLRTMNMTGTELLASNGIGLPFANDIVQASTRVNYAQNLPTIHGLETMVCMATDGAVSIEGGNWRVFQRMLEASGANVLLETEAKAIHKSKDGRFVIETETSRVENAKTIFDAVIVAAPFHQTEITTHIDGLSIPESVKYVALHVTLFTSPCKLSRAVFNVPIDQEVPLTVLTTLPLDEDPKDGPDAAGSPGFYSISTLDLVENPATGKQEFLYKIFSPKSPRSEGIIDLLDTTVLDDPRDAITWVHRKLWYSYPEEIPRTHFDDIELSRNFWYTGGMETFISTMETNALMGKNVANLLISRFALNTANDL